MSIFLKCNYFGCLKSCSFMRCFSLSCDFGCVIIIYGIIVDFRKEGVCIAEQWSTTVVFE